MKRAMLIAIGLSVLLIGAVFAIGAAPPIAHRASRTMHLRATPEQVYAVVAGPPDWHPGVVTWPPDGSN